MTSCVHAAQDPVLAPHLLPRTPAALDALVRFLPLQRVGDIVDEEELYIAVLVRARALAQARVLRVRVPCCVGAPV